MFVLIGVAVVVGAFLLGGYYGFTQGYSYSVYHGSISAAYQTVSELESINSRDISAAMNKLEMRLDSHIIEHWSGLVDKPLIDLRFFAHDDNTVKGLMGIVAKYRIKHPSKAEDMEVRKAIDVVIAKYLN